MNLSHLDDGFIVQPLLMSLHLGSHQLVLFVRVKALPHGQLPRSPVVTALTMLLWLFTATYLHTANEKPMNQVLFGICYNRMSLSR